MCCISAVADLRQPTYTEVLGAKMMQVTAYKSRKVSDRLYNGAYAASSIAPLSCHIASHVPAASHPTNRPIRAGHLHEMLMPPPRMAPQSRVRARLIARPVPIAAHCQQKHLPALRVVLLPLLLPLPMLMLTTMEMSLKMRQARRGMRRAAMAAAASTVVAAGPGPSELVLSLYNALARIHASRASSRCPVFAVRNAQSATHSEGAGRCTVGAGVRMQGPWTTSVVALKKLESMLPKRCFAPRRAKAIASMHFSLHAGNTDSLYSSLASTNKGCLLLPRADRRL